MWKIKSFLNTKVKHIISLSINVQSSNLLTTDVAFDNWISLIILSLFKISVQRRWDNASDAYHFYYFFFFSLLNPQLLLLFFILVGRCHFQFFFFPRNWLLFTAVASFTQYSTTQFYLIVKRNKKRNEVHQMYKWQFHTFSVNVKENWIELNGLEACVSVHHVLSNVKRNFNGNNCIDYNVHFIRNVNHISVVWYGFTKNFEAINDPHHFYHPTHSQS